MTFTLRPFTAADAPAARALADAVLGDAPYGEHLRFALDSLTTSASDEYRALIAHDGTMLSGLVVFGETAGANGAGRIYVIAVDARGRRRGIATALAHAAYTDLAQRGARFVAAELPDDPRLDGARLALLRAGFREEARVTDHVRDGISLLLLRRDCPENA